ncbi:hypothetical protein A9P82_07210 [Arachidicoccus ginsenosidimutans]|uniref:glycoside hydrolase family 127 protein n=1 Tax=Arachidicoccus sp. BS20 TaxID=1850526 RepID=UPI0007F05DC6|nr:glycoside hydrolase family 127 protein [Arachidicoccus sp. BS20]ANI89095.1 hypothetical protein A9P82_07210 [Arachidicoccus sp. BS20]
MKKNLSIIFLFAAFCSLQVCAQSYIPVKNENRFKVKPVVPIDVYGFNLSDVRLLPGTPFFNAQEKDSAYLLELDPNRLLSRFYKNAHLPTKGKEYGGWESEGLSGHTLGHYLSATSMMYASTGDTVFKNRVEYIVGELAKCQAARKTGYVGAIPNEDSIFYKVSIGDIHTGGFDLNGGWSPWYTVHKVMAGLVDAYLYCGNRQALKVVTGMADWTGNILKNLNEEQLQKMLRCEYGGMNDVLAYVYAITGNKKYLDISNKFYDDFVMQPLSNHIDALQNKHANTNIPKGIGAATQYIWSGTPKDSAIAGFMWRTIVEHHIYANGGEGNYEYFGDEDKLSDRLSDDNTETCPSYNMLKLTRQLFALHPTSELGDFYERTLINHILATENPETGMFCYFVPLRSGGEKQFSDEFNTFTCCVGTGMENHSKYGESIFYEGSDGNSLYVNMFIPATLTWRERQTQVTVASSILSGNDISISINAKKKQHFILKLRKPKWSNDYAIDINGKSVPTVLDKDGFVEIDRTWKPGDKITYHLQRTLYTEAMPDNPNRIAIFYGPVLLSGNLGDTMPDPVMGIPVLLTDDKQPADWIKPVDTKNLLFKTAGASKPFDVNLQPFYASYKNYYNVYWDYFTNKDWTNKQAAYKAQLEKEKYLEAHSVDVFRIGEMQPERDHHLTVSGNSYVSEAFGKHGREVRAGGKFSFDMKVDGNAADSLVITYIGADKNHHFDILVNGVLLATENLKDEKADAFYDKTYSIPQNLITGKTSISITIDAKYNSTAGRVFGARIIH